MYLIIIKQGSDERHMDTLSGASVKTDDSNLLN